MCSTAFRSKSASRFNAFAPSALLSFGALTLVIALAMVAHKACAQQPKGDAAMESRGPLTLEMIAARREQASAATDLEKDVSTAIAELYSSAEGHLNSAAQFNELRVKYADALKTVEDRASTAQRQLDEVPGWEAKPPEASSQSQLDQEAIQRKNRFDELRQSLDSIDQQTKTRPTRRREIQSRLAVAEQETQQLRRELEATSATGESPILTLAKRTDIVALLQQLDAEVPALREEFAMYNLEDAVELLRIERELVAAKLFIAEKELELATSTANAFREQAARETVILTKEESEAVDPALKALADENNELAEVNHGLTQEAARHEEALKRIADQYEQLKSDFALSQQKVDSVKGLPASLGAVLRQQRSDLPSARFHQSEIKNRQRLIDESQLALFDIDEQRSQVAGIEARVQADISNQAISAPAQVVLKSQLRDLIKRERELLDAIWKAQNTSFNALTDASIKQQQLVEVRDEFADFIDERVLWIRSDPSVASTDFWNGLREESPKIPHWRALTQLIANDVTTYPVMYVSVIGLFLLLLWAGLWLKRLLGELGDEARKGACTSFAPTIRATLVTCLLAVPVPFLVGFISWCLFRVGNGDESVINLSQSLYYFAVVFGPFEILRQMFRVDGLADAHFQWPSTAVSLLWKWFTVLIVLVPLLVLAMTFMHSGHSKLGGSTIERLCFIATLIIYAVFSINVFHPNRGVLAEYLARKSDGWLFRLRHVGYWLFISVPISLAVLAAMGYFYTSTQLATRFHLTLSLLSAAFILFSMLLRLILIQRRTLRIAQARKRQSAAIAEQAGIASSSAVEDTPIVDLRDQSDQTRRFLGIVFATVVLLGIWFAWHDVLPALGFLERWPLWTSTQTMTIADEAGNMGIKSISDPVTIAEFAFALLIGIVTLIAAQNLPGLLEISVLQRLPLESSVRYAITTLGKYLIMLVGLFIAFRLIGLRWGQIQWMATALTFGLAFGLQEMFANFVAGVIILFERPIRVGDIVTIDDVTGTVSRIRMRATTITNYDRKDYIVPNKDFITGRLLNWTLSDHVNRIVVPVGVAYGSDKALVKQTLVEIATDNTLIVDEPPPLVTFEEFKDSSLAFVLRCFISMRDMPHRLTVVDDLHTRIDDAFRQKGITVAFPQQDLHIQSLVSPAAGPDGAGPNGNAASGNGTNRDGDTHPKTSEKTSN